MKPMTLNIPILDYMIAIYLTGYYTLNDKIYLKHLNLIKKELGKPQNIDLTLDTLKQMLGPYTIITAPLYNDLFSFIYRKLHGKSLPTGMTTSLITKLNGTI